MYNTIKHIIYTTLELSSCQDSRTIQLKYPVYLIYMIIQKCSVCKKEFCLYWSLEFVFLYILLLMFSWPQQSSKKQETINLSWSKSKQELNWNVQLHF